MNRRDSGTQVALVHNNCDSELARSLSDRYYVDSFCNCPGTPTRTRVMRTEKGGGRMVPREPLTGMARIPQHLTFRWETS